MTKEAGKIYNELSFDQRRLLNACMMENELRVIKLEQQRIMERANKAVAEYQVRYNNIKRSLDQALAEINAQGDQE